MARFRIRTLLAVSMGGLVLVATATVLAIALSASGRNTFEMLSDRAVMLIDGIETEVRGRLDLAGGAVDGLAREVRGGALRGAEPDRMLEALRVVLAAAPELETLVYWDRGMVRRGVYRTPDGTLDELEPVDETNARIRDALASLPAGTGHGWSGPLVEDGVTYVSVAVRLGPEVPGVAFIAAAVSLERFSAFVKQLGERAGATAFLLYGGDRLLAHPSLAEGEGHAVAAIALASDPVIANLRQGRPIPFMATARRRGVEVTLVEAGDARYVVMRRWLEGYGPEPIGVGAYFERTEVIDELERLAYSGVAGIVVAAIAVLAAVLLGGWIARPVGRLAESAAAVARLEFGKAERPTPSLIAEVDEQARAFNVMLDALEVFQTYVPRRLVRRLLALGGGRAMASETRELTVMFTDIERFTAIAERMGAADTAAFLSRHFGLLADCIRAEGGTIDKYIGDAVMAFWGAPDHMADHAERAVRAARCIARTIAADNRRRARKGLRPVRVRIGLHSGAAVAGNIGAPDRVNYTIVGDTVNVAQRIESLCHALDGGADVTVLMSAETARLAGLGPEETEDVGAHRLAGIPQEVGVRRLDSRPAAAAAQATAVPSR